MEKKKRKYVRKAVHKPNVEPVAAVQLEEPAGSFVECESVEVVSGARQTQNDPNVALDWSNRKYTNGQI